MKNFTLLTSTGRTGTMFFRDYLSETCENSLCLHEPPPSRVFRLLSNMAVHGRIGQDVPGKLFLATRRGISRKYDNYMESSNFLFGCIPSLNSCIDSVKVIHLVRDPSAYAKSHMAHGFWMRGKKLFTRHLPYWFEVKGCSMDDPYELLLLRWAHINRIIALSEHTNPYLRIKFEDLFLSGEQEASNQLNLIRNFVGFPPLPTGENTRWLGAPRNASKRKKETVNIAEKYRNFILDNITEELSEFGYSYD